MDTVLPNLRRIAGIDSDAVQVQSNSAQSAKPTETTEAKEPITEAQQPKTVQPQTTTTATTAAPTQPSITKTVTKPVSR